MDSSSLTGPTAGKQGGGAGKEAHSDFDAGTDQAINLKGAIMNKDQIKGSLKETAGKVQEKTGELTGNTSQQVKGAAKQVEGNVQKAYGDAKEAAKD